MHTIATDRRVAVRALVTGAASGLGRACVQVLAERGARVAGLDLVSEGIDADLALACDVSDNDAVSGVVTRVAESWGGLDAVAHCAATFPSTAVPLHVLPPQVWDRTVAVNLTGAFHVARATLPHLLRSRGALVLVASAAAQHPQPGAAVYAATKAGVAGLARALAVDYAHRGVRVNAVSPGWMDTTMAAPVLGRPRLRERVEQRIPLRRVAAPEEVAATVAWLLSEDAGYVTGHDLAVDGAMGLMSYVDDGDIETTWRRVKD
jgi:NAD(P)-dependent dehydrogenase (short-subunit alcohol dehydrogenase family)